MLTGGCFCGTVRYEAAGQPFDCCICHCRNCRQTTGAPAVAWFTVRPAAFRFTAGEPTSFASSETGVRRFCGTCGAQLTFQDSRYDEVDVTTASLDDSSTAAPIDQTWVQSRLPWMTGLGALPELARGHHVVPAAAQSATIRGQAGKPGTGPWPR